jgi:hypothetical protein
MSADFPASPGMARGDNVISCAFLFVLQQWNGVLVAFYLQGPYSILCKTTAVDLLSTRS